MKKIIFISMFYISCFALISCNNSCQEFEKLKNLNDSLKTELSKYVRPNSKMHLTSPSHMNNDVGLASPTADSWIGIYQQAPYVNPNFSQLIQPTSFVMSCAALSDYINFIDSKMGAVDSLHFFLAVNDFNFLTLVIVGVSGNNQHIYYQGTGDAEIICV